MTRGRHERETLTSAAGRNGTPGNVPAVVVGVDGSEGAKQALSWALAEARLRKSPLRAVHAWMFGAFLARESAAAGPVAALSVVGSNGTEPEAPTG
jgi:nucleotide-binding universal stress UspA family protein